MSTPPAAAGQTLYVVDDDEQFRTLLGHIARDVGFVVEPFARATEALARIESGDVPDVLVVDGLLPDLLPRANGLEMIRRVAARPGKRPRVVFLSAFFKDMRSHQELKNLGVEKVLHKPIEAASLRAELATMFDAVDPGAPAASDDGTAALMAEIDALRRAWIAALPGTAARIDELANSLARSEEGAQDALRMVVHRVAGTAGTYGLDAISTRAASLESLLTESRSVRDIVRPSAQLAHEMRLAAAADDASSARTSGQPGAAGATPRGANWPRRILLVDDDPRLPDEPWPELGTAGIEVRRARNELEAHMLLRSFAPDVAVLEYALGGRECGPEVAAGLRDRLARGTPVVFLTARDGLERRVQAVSAGAALYLAKPMAGTDLLRELGRYAPLRCNGCSVLLVDDDPTVIAQVNALLNPLGISVTPASGPEEFWASLSSELPTMVLLDVSLPIYSGFELCRALKADPRFREVPVVFLTARLGVTDRTAAFQAGADDYIPKPLSPDEFIARVTGRLQTAMQARERAFRDRLTGLMGRAAIEDALARTIRRLARQIQQSGGVPAGRASPGLMLFDVDHFKKINDTAGHLTGDYALQQVARALEQSVRATDVVGRWGGEEFMVVLSEGGSGAFRAVFDRVRSVLAARPVYGPNGFTRTMTLSAGAMALTHWDKPLEVVARADEALYKAKQNGRDRLELGEVATRAKA